MLLWGVIKVVQGFTAYDTGLGNEKRALGYTTVLYCTIRREPYTESKESY